MIRLRLFGSTDLVAGRGEELRQVLSQPKRFGLLCYLALAEPAGFHRRDTLLALFWPELDTESARRALRQSLHFLRTHLGPEVIEGRGVEEVRLAAGALWCDVLAYREALAAGRLAEALELRRGELLPGFHVRDAAPEFEEWLNGQRAELRQSAALAASTLAASEEAHGRPARALAAARRALELAPTDEASARTVMRLSHALDDGEGALEVFDALRRRLREFDSEVDGDTRALADAIRRELSARPAGARATGPAPAPPAPPPVPVAPRGVAPKRTRAWPALALATVLVGVAALPVLGAFDVGPAAALFSRGAAKRDLLVVTDFTAPDGDASLARVVSYAVRDGLTQSGALEVMSPSHVASTLELMARPRDARVDAGTAREVALREGGTAVVDGEVAQVGTGYVVTVRLLAAESDRVLATIQRVGDGPQGLIEVADELARALRRAAGESLRDVEAAVPLRRARTASLAAARLYTEGAYANEVTVDWPLAAAKFREAVATDSTFAMAWLYLGAVLQNLGAPTSQVEDATLRAYALRDRLPPTERLTVEANYFARGPGRDRARAIAAYRLLPQSWNNLALQYQRRREFARAESTWRAGLAVDSSNRLAMRNLGLNLRLQGKLGAADSVNAVMARRFGTDASVLFNGALGVLLRGDVAGAERIFDSLARAPGAGRWARTTRGHIALLRGQRDTWRAAVGLPAAADPSAGREVPPIEELASLAALEVRVFGRAPAELDEVERRLARAPLTSLPEADRPYLPVATSLAWAGRPERASALLREYARTVRDTALRRSQLADLRTAEGAVAFAQRRYREAITLFRQGDSLPDGPAHLVSARLPLYLGLSFDGANEPDSAIAQFERYLSLPVMGRLEPQLDPASLAHVRERLGQLYEARGDLGRAAANYRAFVELWEHADPELQPRVAAARARLKRLPSPPASSNTARR